VVMSDGSVKAIEDVKVGDKVVATDPTTGKTTSEAVTDTITGTGEKHLVRITIDVDGKRGGKTGVVTATDHHPFWVPALKRWVDAGKLKPGMWLQTGAGTYVQITAIRAWTQHRQVHNLTVDRTHTY
jgi:DNA polymerase II large subunit